MPPECAAQYGGTFWRQLFCNAVTRRQRLAAWVELTYKSPTTLAVASAGQFGATTARNWLDPDVKAEPTAGNLAELHKLGLNPLWYLTGEGSMFSDTPKGRALEQSAPLPDPGQSTSDPQSPDRTHELIARIDALLKEYR